MNDFLQKSELLDVFLQEKNGSAPVTVPARMTLPAMEIGFRNASFSWSLDDAKDSGLVTPSNRIFRLQIEGELLFKRIMRLI